MFRNRLFLAVTSLLAATFCAKATPAAPIALHDGLIWADVESCGKSLHFVVDTGAATSCLDLAAAKCLGIRLDSPTVITGVGGWATGYRCTGLDASFAGMALPGTVVALDLSGPSRGCRQKIDGLIGADFFDGKVLRIDYARRLIGQLPAAPDRGGIELRFENGVICVPVAVNGAKPRWTRLDTGCTEALCWCDGADCRRPGAWNSIALASWAGNAVRANIRVGAVQLDDLPVNVSAREIFPGEAGLLGNAALSKYRVTIDGIRNRLILDSGQ